MSEITLAEATVEIQKAARLFRAFEKAEQVIEALSVSEQTSNELTAKVAAVKNDLAKAESELEKVRDAVEAAKAEGAATAEKLKADASWVAEAASKAAAKIVEQAKADASALIEAAKAKAVSAAEASSKAVLAEKAKDISDADTKLAELRKKLADLKAGL